MENEIAHKTKLLLTGKVFFPRPIEKLCDGLGGSSMPIG